VDGPVKPRIRWYVWVRTYDGHRPTGSERIPHEATMRGSWLGWDVECSCGWGSHTGGAIKARVEEARADHLYFEHGIPTGIFRGLPPPTT